MLIFPTPKQSPLTGMVGYGGGATGLTNHSATAKYSLFFEDENDYISTTDASDHAPGTGDYTFEAWMKFVNGPNQCVLMTGSGGMQLRWTSDTVSRTENINSAFIVTTNATTWNNNTWYHYAVCRSGTSERIFQNGTEIGSATTSQNWNITSPMKVGQNYNGSSHNGYYLHSGRFDVGIAHYTSNFTPPSDTLAVTNNTISLIGTTATANEDFEGGGTNNISWSTNGSVTTVEDHPWA